jgi:hypothetical protein
MPKERSAPREVAVSFVFLTVLGFGLVLFSTAVGVAEQGHPGVSRPIFIITVVAFWPSELLALVGFEAPMKAIGYQSSALFFFGIPALGWGCLGIPVGLWRARQRAPDRL